MGEGSKRNMHEIGQWPRCKLIIEMPVKMKCGINPKPKHFDGLLLREYEFGFLEFHTENLFLKGLAYSKIEKLRADYEFSFHSVGVSLGSYDGLRMDHVAKITAEIDRFDPILVSEHLSFSGIHQRFTPDLLPLPLNDESLSVFIRNIDEYQNAINRRVLIENPSQYIAFQNETYELHDFLNEICARTGCGVLLDVNNLEVCDNNIGANAMAIIEGLKPENIGQFHLAGYKEMPKPNGTIFLDNHGARVFPKVWELYRAAIKRFGNLPSLLEWDDEVPELLVLNQECDKANSIKSEVLAHEFA